jgi:lysozyme family protein
MFEQAIQKTLVWEGGYANLTGDSGGETYRGISRRNWPNWNGWLIVDAAKSQSGFPRSLDSDQNLLGLVVQFYRTNFWQPEYDQLSDSLVSDKIFDISVNVGKVHGHKIAQRAAGVNEDGVFGQGTVKAINSHPQDGSFLATLRYAAESYHRSIVSAHPEDARFLAGWLRRDDS